MGIDKNTYYIKLKAYGFPKLGYMRRRKQDKQVRDEQNVIWSSYHLNMATTSLFMEIY